MNKQSLIGFLGKFILIINFVGLIVLSVFVGIFFQKYGANREEKDTIIEEDIIQTDNCMDNCKTYVDSAIASLSGENKSQPLISPTPIVKTATLPPSTSRSSLSYIPISGPITTTNTGWMDAPGTDIYIDVINDYGKNAYVTWEGFLQVANGNGQAFARLFDATHGIAVNGSEISTTNEKTTQLTSGKLDLWQGRNLYRVQIKSLNSFVVTFTSGRIKISY